MPISKLDLINRGPIKPDNQDTMHVSIGASFKIPRATRALRACNGLIMVSMTDGTFAVGRALREGAEVGRLTPVFDTREAADKFFNETKDAK